MEPVTTGLMVAALLAREVVQSAAGEAGKSAWLGAQRLYQAVRRRLAGNPDAEAALTRLQQQPDSDLLIRSLAKAIDFYVLQDDRFADELALLLRDATDDNGTAKFITQIHSGAQVGNLVNIETVRGDVNL